MCVMIKTVVPKNRGLIFSIFNKIQYRKYGVYVTNNHMYLSYLKQCRICKNNNLLDVISLGEQYITSRFPVYGDFSTPKTTINLCMCQTCGLIQLREIINSKELYEYEYGYRSGISNTMRSHLKSYTDEIVSIVDDLKEGDVIVDVGSNDSTMLQYYGNKYCRIGVDPTSAQFAQYYGEVKMLPTYFTETNFKNAYSTIKCKIVSSISMFYDLPDPVQFAKDVHSILEDDGIWTCEQSYILSMLRTNSVDTICHEHLEYYGLHQIKEITDRSGFKIIDVFFNDCNGGSFRVYFAKKESTKYCENVAVIKRILQEEVEYGIMDKQVYYDFMGKCNEQINYLKDFIRTVNANGKTVHIYGASTKGNCLLQHANLDETFIKYAVERNLNKVGKMTSTGIEIISEETMRQNMPDYLLVLPWHFKTEILEREKAFLDAGGQFIFPFPFFEIVGNKPKLLITGCDGMIAQYIKERFANEYNMYGITRSQVPTYEKNTTVFVGNVSDAHTMEHHLKIVKPQAIIHLASVSSSKYAFANVTETIKNNGLAIAQLCEIIHKNGWNTKLFNASSSDIYKGNVNYFVEEDDPNKYHCHPYSIAKIMGHSIVDFYRIECGLPFSNGVIFTTESSKKRPEFLLNKVAAHIRSGCLTALTVGNLDSYRNIIHASDVANAIYTIVSQEKGDNYLICGNESHQMSNLVKQLFTLNNVEIHERVDGFYEIATNRPVLLFDKTCGTDSAPINIGGKSVKLKKLGWEPLKTVEDILLHLLSE